MICSQYCLPHLVYSMYGFPTSIKTFCSPMLCVVSELAIPARDLAADPKTRCSVSPVSGTQGELNVAHATPWQWDYAKPLEIFTYTVLSARAPRPWRPHTARAAPATSTPTTRGTRAVKSCGLRRCLAAGAHDAETCAPPRFPDEFDTWMRAVADLGTKYKQAPGTAAMVPRRELRRTRADAEVWGTPAAARERAWAAGSVCRGRLAVRRRRRRPCGCQTK